MDKNKGQNLAESQDLQERRIRALELQVQTLTQTLAYVMEVTKPLIELAQRAQEQVNTKIWTE